MTTLATLALLAALAPPSPLTPAQEARLEHAESRGSTWAVSPTGARGVWQVDPRWSLVPAWALHVYPIGTWEGRRILRRWQRRCGGDIRCALRCYACGRAGLRGACGGYLAAVVAAGGAG